MSGWTNGPFALFSGKFVWTNGAESSLKALVHGWLFQDLSHGFTKTPGLVEGDFLIEGQGLLNDVRL